MKYLSFGTLKVLWQCRGRLSMIILTYKPPMTTMMMAWI
jgi:hypothetical protein